LSIFLISDIESLERRLKVLEDMQIEKKTTSLEKFGVLENDFIGFPSLPEMDDFSAAPQDPYAFVRTWWFIGAMISASATIVLLSTVFGFLCFRKKKAAKALRQLAVGLEEDTPPGHPQCKVSKKPALSTIDEKELEMY